MTGRTHTAFTVQLLLRLALQEMRMQGPTSVDRLVDEKEGSALYTALHCVFQTASRILAKEMAREASKP